MYGADPPTGLAVAAPVPVPVHWAFTMLEMVAVTPVGGSLMTTCVLAVQPFASVTVRL